MALYEFLRPIFQIFFRAAFRCRVAGREYIPRDGGVIIAANHLSFWDPPLIASFLPRRVHYMAKEELFRVRVVGAVFRKFGSFPVRRGASDRAAIRTALEIVGAGRCLGLFPEGTRSKTGRLGAIEPGAALLAVKAGVPIVPTAVIGTDQVWRRFPFLPRLEVRFGPPIVLPAGKADKRTLTLASEKITRGIQELLSEK